MKFEKRTISRRKFLAVAGAGLAGGLAACAPPPAAPSSSAPAAATEAPAAPKEAPAPAASVELLYLYPNFSGVPKDQDAVNEAINNFTQTRGGFSIKLNSMDFGGWGDKINLMNAGGEKYDLAYTANWTNDYYKNVSNGVFVDIAELLKSKAPKFYSSMPETTWNAAKVKGAIYGGINQQMFPKVSGLIIRKDLAEKYKMPLDAITKLSDIEPYLEQILKDEKMVPFSTANLLDYPETVGYVPIDDAVYFAWVDPADKDAKVFNKYENTDFKNNWDLIKRWYDKGYLPKEPYADQAAEREAWKAGKHAFQSNPVTKPSGEFEAQSILGQEVVLVALAKPVITTAGITATMTGVSRTGNPEAAMQWLELVNTEKELYNMMCIGVEGKHWNWKDKSKEVIEQVKDSAYNPTTDWMFGNQFNAYYRDERQVGSWDKTKEINDKATPSPTLGFVMDRDPVKTELASMSAINDQYTAFGPKSTDSSILSKVVDEMNGVGASKIIEEMQKQIEAWKKGG
jgi:putative aldouronate transport system substrate-binding protein